MSEDVTPTEPVLANIPEPTRSRVNYINDECKRLYESASFLRALAHDVAMGRVEWDFAYGRVETELDHLASILRRDVLRMPPRQ